jgi:hypothetical protein
LFFYKAVQVALLYNFDLHLIAIQNICFFALNKLLFTLTKIVIISKTSTICIRSTQIIFCVFIGNNIQAK